MNRPGVTNMAGEADEAAVRAADFLADRVAPLIRAIHERRPLPAAPAPARLAANIAVVHLWISLAEQVEALRGAPPATPDARNFEAWASALEERESELEARESADEERDLELGAREAALEIREAALGVREGALEAREASVRTQVLQAKIAARLGEKEVG